jgi:predicted small secreted protein
MTTHTHFIIGSYLALAIAVLLEVYFLKRQRKQVLLTAQSIANEGA